MILGDLSHFVFSNTASSTTQCLHYHSFCLTNERSPNVCCFIDKRDAGDHETEGDVSAVTRHEGPEWRHDI